MAIKRNENMSKSEICAVIFGIEKFFNFTRLVVFYVNSYFFLYVLTESSRTAQSKRTRRERDERVLQELIMQCANVCAPNLWDEWANVFTFFSGELSALGLLDTITSTENAKDCPGVCVHALATLICYEVLEDIKCPTSSMKCCVESSSAGKIWPLGLFCKIYRNRFDLAANTSTSTYRPSTRYTTTTTPRPTTEHVRHTTGNKNGDKKDNECPGVCVADRIADYCEAYLKTPNLCKSGTKCCVAKDSYMDNPDLRVLIGSQNSSKTPVKPQKVSEKVCLDWGANRLTRFIFPRKFSFFSSDPRGAAKVQNKPDTEILESAIHEETSIVQTSWQQRSRSGVQRVRRRVCQWTVCAVLRRHRFERNLSKRGKLLHARRQRER